MYIEKAESRTTVRPIFPVLLRRPTFPISLPTEWLEIDVGVQKTIKGAL